MQSVFSDNEFSNQIQLLPLGFVIIVHEQIIYANEAANKLLDQDNSGSLMGKHFADFIHEVCRKHYFDELMVARNTKISWPLQLRLNNNEYDKYIEVLVTRFIYEGNEAYQIIVSDVTLKKNIETEMKKLLAQAFRSNKLATLGELVAGVAHEVNNPLSIILTYLEIIRDHLKAEPVPNPITLKAVDKQEAAVRRITEIVKGLRTYARENIQDIFNVDVHYSINSTVTLINFIYKKQNILFDLELDAAKSIVRGNLGKLQQVFMNLFSNARDAILEKETKEEGRITVTSFNKENSVVIKVSDNGLGISQNNIDKIFHSFFTTKDEEKGTGLGLSISYSFINDLKGSLSVDSQVGVGTTFTITIPLWKS